MATEFFSSADLQFFSSDWLFLYEFSAKNHWFSLFPTNVWSNIAKKPRDEFFWNLAQNIMRSLAVKICIFRKIDSREHNYFYTFLPRGPPLKMWFSLNPVLTPIAVIFHFLGNGDVNCSDFLCNLVLYNQKQRPLALWHKICF